MKRRLNLFTVLTIFLITINLNLYPQGCLPEGIAFTTQEEIDNFPTNYPNCTIIEGDLTITGETITNLDALSSLIEIEGSLKIGTIFIHNPNLTSLEGLHNITEIGAGLSLINNDILSTLSGLDHLAYINGNLQIGVIGNGNPALISLFGLNKLTTITNSLVINSNPQLGSIQDLHDLTSVGWGISVFDNDLLENFAGLSNLTSLNGILHIQSNDALASLSGLHNITSVVGLQCHNNSKLINFEGLNSLTNVIQNIEIWDNDSLQNLNGLDNLMVLYGELQIVNNDALSNLSGMYSLSSNSIDGLSIYNNDQLANCHASSICNYLVSPNGFISIYDNATGCNSIQEVQEACFSEVNEEEESLMSIQIFPNPAKDEITIKCPEKIHFEELCIYSQTGKKLVCKKGAENTIDISNLNPGLYFVELETENTRFREKLIVY